MVPARCAWTPCTVPTARCRAHIAPNRATAATERLEPASVSAHPDTGDCYATSNASVSMVPRSAPATEPVIPTMAHADASPARNTVSGPVICATSVIHFTPLPTVRCDARPIEPAHLAVDAPLAMTGDAPTVFPRMEIPKNCSVVPFVNLRALCVYHNAPLASGARTAINCALAQASLNPAMHALDEASAPMLVVAVAVPDMEVLRASTPVPPLHLMGGFSPAQAVVCAPAPTTASAFSAMRALAAP